MPPDPVIDEEEDYASSEDSDFAPDNTAQQGDSDASDSDDAGTNADRKKGRDSTEADQDDAGYNNSGDEAIIRKGGKKLEKRRLRDGDDEGGDGGLIKTRRQRAAEKEEKKHNFSTGPVTIDVDSMWEQMMSNKLDSKPQSSAVQIVEVDMDHETERNEPAQAQQERNEAAGDVDKMIRIKRTYNFAGQVHTEEKMVSRDSAEAKLFLASGGEPVPAAESTPVKRNTRKAFRSAFEPLFDHPLPQRGDLNLGVAARQQASKEAQAKKLNTVEKSRMDWAGFVDKEGIKEDLELASKSKDSYTARQDFLNRSEAIRDADARQARSLGKA